jgi:transcriptional regulator with XRE-family HTH domain
MWRFLLDRRRHTRHDWRRLRPGSRHTRPGERLMARPFPVLSLEARAALHMSQREFAGAVGSSLRTVQRWETRRSEPASFQIHRVADAVRPHDPELAAELDELAPRPTPPPPPVPQVLAPPLPPPPPPPPPLPATVLLDSVVCAAAEAMTLAPQALRPALLAAFARAKEAGLSMEAVIEGLTPPKAKAPASRTAG